MGRVYKVKDFRSILSEEVFMSDHNFRERLEKIKHCMRKLPYIHSQGRFRYYTDHGTGHSEAVIKILDKLTESVELSEYENFLLKCGAWLHDIGMLMWEGENTDNPEVCNRIREEHHKRSAEYISKHWREIGLSDETEATIIRWICRAHSSKVNINEVPEEIPAAGENVRTRLLAALLRLADALDCREDRLPPEEYRLLPQIPQESQEEYWKHEIVEKVEIKGSKICVEMLLKYKDHKEKNVADKVEEKIKEELNSVRGVLERYNLHFELDFNVIEPPELEEGPTIRTIEAYKRVRNEDELKDVVEDDRFLETPYRKGFQTWEEFKSTVYNYYEFKEPSEGQILAIYGDIGVGKTTYMLLLVERIIKREKEEVIFLNSYEYESSISQVEHEYGKLIVIDALGHLKADGNVEEALKKKCERIVDFAKRNRVKMIITMRNSEKEILDEVLRGKGFELIPYEVKPEPDDMRNIIARYIKYFNVSIAGIHPDEACGMIESGRMSEVLDNAMGLLVERSNNAPFYIRHLMHEHRSGTLSMEEIERLPKGVENILMDTIRELLRGDEGDMTFIKLLITISKLEIFSKFLYDAIYERIAQGNEAKEQKEAFEKYMQSEGWLYSLSQYWRDAINSAIEGRIEDRELANKFFEASSDALKPEDVRAVIREEIEKAFDEGKINFYLIADAVQSAPDIDMLSFAYDSFKKAKDIEAPGKDIARISLAAHFFYLGNALYKQKNFENSIKAYSTSLGLNEHAKAYYNRGLVYAEQEKYDEAIKDFDKAIELNPDDAEAYHNRGIAYTKLGEYDEAIKDFDKAIELNPDDAEAYHNRGNAYARLGEYERAREDMLHAGNLFTDKGRIEDAIRACGWILGLGEESERVIAGRILLLLSYISGSDSANDIKERLNEMGYMDGEVLRNAIERLKRREESRWLIHIFSALRNVYNRMRDKGGLQE
ncbi:MAG TPA: tetratricopeptide repeat protein [Candidatus Syntrophoarchaeum butanivorans]|uniref:Metal-dependent phosphohydrolase, HD region, subdomain protein domain protein n=1 Tax=Candidatus Syntropharchaeum butanivorans TaxID=1839936 RepID=A0A1F2P4Q2_9EURY|nr:MAG: Metal-dependent phosphohydrolase, HD region, subdomain protein domain protein [Candidatus Syntrophoarchaeum butanivorans]HEC56454.1 tetratricopeptide repeat protein [Candidatus Syntrophoarchaeum butanivorans]